MTSPFRARRIAAAPLCYVLALSAQAQNAEPVAKFTMTLSLKKTGRS